MIVSELSVVQISSHKAAKETVLLFLLHPHNEDKTNIHSVLSRPK